MVVNPHKDGVEPPVGGSMYDQGRTDFCNDVPYSHIVSGRRGLSTAAIRDWQQGWIDEQGDLARYRIEYLKAASKGREWR